jgi:uncharacterized membrane protein
MKKNNSGPWIIVAICAVLLISFFGFAGFGNYGMMGMMGGNFGYGMMFYGWITWILVIALMIAAIYWFIKSANKKR